MAAIDQMLELVPDAVQEARQRDLSTITVLASKCGIAEDTVTATLAGRLGLRAMTAADLTAATVLHDVIPIAELRERRCLCVAGENRAPAIVVDDPWDDEVIAWLTGKLGRRPQRPRPLVLDQLVGKEQPSGRG